MGTAATSGGMNLLAHAQVGDLASRPHARVTVDALVGEVVEQMRTMGRGCAVVEEDGALVGIFTERDLLNRVDRADRDWRTIPIHLVMTSHPIAIRAADSLAEAMRHMTARRLRHLPIVDGDHVIGLISIRDVLAYIAGRFPEEMMNLPPDPHPEI